MTLFCRHQGKITAIAAGVRRPTSRKSGHLELFNHSRVFLARGRNLDLIIEAETIEPFEKIKKNLEKIGQAYYLTELVDQLTREEESLPSVFQLLLEHLSWLNQLDSLDYVSLQKKMRSFEITLLKILGFWSDKMFGKKKPQTLSEWARFNRVFIERIIEKDLKSPEFLKHLQKSNP